MSTWAVSKDTVKKNYLIKKYFYRSLKDGTIDDSDEKVDGHISDKEYLTCYKIWNELYTKNMGYYHDYHLEKDVLLLVDVFKKFIDRCLKLHKLDSCHYFSSPGLSWDLILKITGITLEKISDISIYIFIEKGLKRGISYICKRYSEANNKYMKNYDPKKPSKYIEYLDKNNLCGWGMSGYLPYGGFKSLRSANTFDVNSISETSSIGYKSILNILMNYTNCTMIVH